ncbi:MAG: aconitate hydratase, partial [Lentisphaeria bacterium]|nr:aconitate hydratase [Lentisphaeria bacterium]
KPLPDRIDGIVLIKTPDKTSTDDIMPAGVHLKHRSNIPEYAKVVFERFTQEGKPTFAQRASAARDAGKHGIIVGRESYGQGSSREHAAICPMYLGVKALIAVSIERIHAANLVNFGIVPFTFADPEDYEKISEGDSLFIDSLRSKLEKGEYPVEAKVVSPDGKEKSVLLNARRTSEDVKIILAGGRLNCK